MELTETKTITFTDEELRKAIEIMISECFPAMNFANAIAGRQSIEWTIIRNFKPEEIFKEATLRKLPLAEFKGSVCGTPIADTWVKKYLV